ncbi:hypothetical protein AB1Y20_010279 [Prymnesium parvum]|uniref:Cyclin N-terminal domain-containing protein n=1 Tax=Prymnesium parvum TaxID=97485 RepID=A0AB34K6P6_PRYPA
MPLRWISGPTLPFAAPTTSSSFRIRRSDSKQLSSPRKEKRSKSIDTCCLGSSPRALLDGGREQFQLLRAQTTNLSPADISRLTCLDLLASFAVVLCDQAAAYSTCSQADGRLSNRILSELSEEHSPLNFSAGAMTHEGVLRLAATLTAALKLDVKCVVLALILLKRLGHRVLAKLLTPNHWRNTVIAAFLLAAKSWYDENTGLRDAQWCLEEYGLYSSNLHRQEFVFLKLINYHVTMSIAQYTESFHLMLTTRLKPEAQRLIDMSRAAGGLAEDFGEKTLFDSIGI